MNFDDLELHLPEKKEPKPKKYTIYVYKEDEVAMFNHVTIGVFNRELASWTKYTIPIHEEDQVGGIIAQYPKHNVAIKAHFDLSLYGIEEKAYERIERDRIRGQLSEI